MLNVWNCVNKSHHFSQDNVQQQQLNEATVHFPSIIHHSVNTVLSEYSFFFEAHYLNTVLFHFLFGKYNNNNST